MTQSLNRYPYYDDFDTTKNFHKILFVPGNPVQARELTQIQSIIQEQIKRHGDHIFKNGTVVLPGHLYYDNDAKYVKVETIYNGANIESYSDFIVGKTVTGQTSGVSAIILHIEDSTATDPTTLFFKYTSANGSVSEFANNEVLKESTTGLEIKIQAVSEYQGDASLCNIDEGIYYINGYFVGVNKHTIAVSKYDNKSSNIVGLLFNEEIISAADDESLYDNSRGFANYGAPGADRLKITLQLVAKPIDYVEDDGDTDLNFIELMKIKDGVLQYKVEDTEYSQINKMLARRTFEQSGNYIVSPFVFKFKNYRSNNRGQWVAATPYLAGDVVKNGDYFYYCRIDGFSGSTAPTHTYGTVSDGSMLWTQTTTPQYNNGLLVDSDSTLDVQRENAEKYAIISSTGKAYINGYEVYVREPKTLTTLKARETSQISDASLFVPIGQYVVVDNLAGSFDPKVVPVLDIKDSTNATVGSCYAKSLEFVSGTPGTTSAKYRLFIFGVQMNTGKDFNLNAVSFAYSTTFSCKVSLVEVQLTGMVSTTASSATVTGKGTIFQTELKVGQLIKVGSETKVISNIASNVSLTVSSNFTNSNTDVAGFEAYAELQSFGPMIKQLDNQFIKTVRDATNQIDTEYTIVRKISITVSGGNTGSSSALTVAGETFASTSSADHITVRSSTGVVYDVTYTLNGTSTVLTITAGSLPNDTYTVLAKIKKRAAAALEKTKTLQTKTITVNSANIKDELDTTVITASYNFSNSTISLTEADIVRLVKITMSGGNVGAAYNATNEVDITSWYTLDNGQKIDFYDLGSIKLKSGYSAPKKPIKVTFEYFDHSSGDYFSVDSYKNLPYEMIPAISFNGTNYNLRDCLDFRSRKSDDGTGFTASGASVSEPFNSTTSISTSYSFYLPRKDVITLSQDGEFIVTNGTSSTRPTEPALISGQDLKMLVINVDAYTSNPVDMSHKNIAHKRYTMEDIGNIDTRVKNVEYYVALNELEKKTAALNVLDENGLTRFKNGFFVDNFTSYITSDIGNLDYAASVNPEEQVVSARNVTHNIALYEVDGTTAASRTSSGYQITGNLISLPYTEEVLIDQPAASKSEFINPYSIISFKNTGVVTLFPESDIWTDTRTDYNEYWTAGSTITVSSSTSYDYNYYYYGYWYGYYGYYYGYWYGYGYGWGGWGQQSTTTTSVVGYQTSTVSKTESQTSQDLSFMRNRSVGLNIVGMKPYTSLYAFLDGANNNSSITPAKTLRFNNKVGDFKGWDDTEKNTESLSARVTTVGTYDSFDYGDVITFYNTSGVATGASAVVAAQVQQVENNVDEIVLKVVNVKGTVNVNDTFRGSLSGATGKVTSLTTETDLKTNSVGDFYGIINFTSQLSTGQKLLKYNDRQDGDTSKATTEVKTTFTAHGTLNITTINETKKTDTLVSQTTTYYNNWYYYYGYYYYYGSYYSY